MKPFFDMISRNFCPLVDLFTDQRLTSSENRTPRYVRSHSRSLKDWGIYIFIIHSIKLLFSFFPTQSCENIFGTPALKYRELCKTLDDDQFHLHTSAEHGVVIFQSKTQSQMMKKCFVW